jgi:hypothetical protein
MFTATEDMLREVTGKRKRHDMVLDENDVETMTLRDKHNAGQLGECDEAEDANTDTDDGVSESMNRDNMNLETARIMYTKLQVTIARLRARNDRLPKKISALKGARFHDDGVEACNITITDRYSMFTHMNKRNEASSAMK